MCSRSRRVPEDARRELEEALQRLSSGRGHVERLADAPAGADPMALRGPPRAAVDSLVAIVQR